VLSKVGLGGDLGYAVSVSTDPSGGDISLMTYGIKFAYNISDAASVVLKYNAHSFGKDIEMDTTLMTLGATFRF
jgi:hypothetical protein